MHLDIDFKYLDFMLINISFTLSSSVFFIKIKCSKMIENDTLKMILIT